MRVDIMMKWEDEGMRKAVGWMEVGGNRNIPLASWTNDEVRDKGGGRTLSFT